MTNNASDTVATGIDEASAAAATSVSHAQNHFETMSNELKNNLPIFYSVGLWSYCKENGSHTSCSQPSISFSFNLSAIFNTTSSDLDDLLSGINKKALSGYRELSQAVIWLYIFGFVSTAFSVVFAARTVFFSAGSKMVVVSCMVRSCDEKLVYSRY